MKNNKKREFLKNTTVVLIILCISIGFEVLIANRDIFTPFIALLHLFSCFFLYKKIARAIDDRFKDD